MGADLVYVIHGGMTTAFSGAYMCLPVQGCPCKKNNTYRSASLFQLYQVAWQANRHICASLAIFDKT
jgi:hypothetical protein